MQTVRYKGVEIHIGCEGTIVRGVCVKCGQRKPSLTERIFGKEPLIQSKPKFDEKAYKERIRRLDDLK